MKFNLIASLLVTCASTKEQGFFSNLMDTLSFKSHFGFEEKEVAAAVSEDFDDRFHTIQ